MRVAFHLILGCCCAITSVAQTNPVADTPAAIEIAFPNRATNTPNGSEFVKYFATGKQLNEARDSIAYGNIIGGNVPSFLRKLRPVSVTNVFAGKTNIGRFFVAPDYLALGSDDDYLLMPL